MLKQQKNLQKITFKQIKQTYNKYFKTSDSQCLFQQIDHGPPQIIPQYFSVQQNCLIINYDAFDRYYPYLFKLLKSENIDEKLIASDILLSMNGQNDRAWNIKKFYLNLKQQNGQQYLNVNYQLKFNQAVCLKCKKSSSYYQYRLKVVEKEINLVLNKGKQQELIIKYIQNIHERQDKLIRRVLQRFFRNYFCWMYRIKFIKLINQYLLKFNQNVIIANFIKSQIDMLHKFIQKYCNDYSAYSYLINFIQKYLLSLQQTQILKEFYENQNKWIKQMKQYCEAVYRSDKNYPHLLMYQKWLSDRQKNK